MSVEKIAPFGKFRVVAVGTFDGTEWIHRDCDTKEKAFEAAKEKRGTMITTYIFDDKGDHIKSEGTL